MMEQPDSLRKTFESELSTMDEVSKLILDKDKVYLIGCGSSISTCYSIRDALASVSDLRIEVFTGYEFLYNKKLNENENSLFIATSQSGETADSLAALRKAKSEGVKTLAIVNVVASSIAREADYVLYTLAGPEISVATTKAFSTQLIVCYLLALELAYIKKYINKDKYIELINELKSLSEKSEYIMKNLTSSIQKISSEFANIKDAFYIGRGLDYAISLEGSLKLKEISYIHSEAYAAGELKHGTISLIEDGTLVIGIVTQKDISEKTISNLMEVKSRGAYIISISPSDIDVPFADYKIIIPKTISYFYPSLSVIPLQLLAYYITVSKGYDVDKPRNLAKSVTVE